MASLGGAVAGGAAGTLIFPGAGTAIGAALGSIAGSYADNEFLFPWLFPPDKARAPQIGDVAQNRSDDGGPALLCVGPECRVPGTIIYRGPINPGSNQGKGSTSSVTSGTDYYVNLGIAWHVGPDAIDGIEEIVAEGKRIYVDDSDVDIDSNQITAERYVTNRWNNTTDASAQDDIYLILKSPNGGPDLSVLRSGISATVAGFTGGGAGNNGTFRVVSSEINTATGESEARLRNDSAADDTPAGVISVDQTLPRQVLSFADSITNYLGTDTQAINSEMQAEREGGEVPAYRGVAWTWIKRLKLNEFGNRIPQFHAIVRSHQTKTLASAIGDMHARAGYATSDYDTSGVTGTVRGLVIAGPTQGDQILVPTITAYNVMARESQGQLEYFDRESATEVAVDPDDVGALELGSNGPMPFDLHSTDEQLLPRKVIVNYLDPFQDEQEGSQPAINASAPGDGVLQARFPIVMTASDAADIANRLLWTRWANSQVVRLRLPPSYLHVEEGDVLTFTLEGEDWRVLVIQLDRGADNFLIEIEGVVEVASTLTFSGTPAEAPDQPQRTTYIPPETRTEILDVAPLRSADVGMSGFYWACSAYDRASQYDRTHLFQASNAALSNWSTIQTMRQEATMGEVVGTVGGKEVYWWDLETTITVKLYHGTLSSAANDVDVLNGDVNQALIGDEIIGFVNAADQGNNVWQLSKLARGRQGTERWTSRHAANERFILLGEETIQEKNKNRGHINRVFAWEGVPHGGSQGDYSEATYPSPSGVFELNRFRPFGPHGLRAQGNSTREYFLYWEPRELFPGSWTPGGGSSSTGRFEIEFWDGDPNPVGSTANYLGYTAGVAGTPNATQYSFFADTTAHTAAGLTPGDAHYVVVYEFGVSPYGRGLRSPALFVDL